MAKYAEQRLLPYMPEQLYTLVADIERYPEFLPWCAGLRVLRREREGGREILIAEMLVGYKSLRERYTSRVVLDKEARTIDVVQTEGVFRALENHWRFTPEGTSARVDFSILFEFKNRMLALAANAVLGPVMLRMSHAFEARAKKLSEQTL